MSRVVVITTSLPRYDGDPSGHFVATEAREAARRGDDVVVIAPGTAAPIEGARVVGLPDGGAFGWPGALARLRERPWRGLAMLRFIAAARSALRDLGPVDRVIAHWVLPCGYPIALAARAELEIVAHGSDVRLLLALPGPLRRRVVGELLDRGARFRFVSAELARALGRDSDPRLAAASRVELPAIDLSSAPTRAQARATLGLAPRERLLLIVSRLVPSKRVDLALCAAAGSFFERVVVVGDGPERSKLEKRFPRVRFLGKKPRSEALAWLAAADVLLSASAAEGAPTVVREARALGVPVVCPAVGDLARWAQVDPGIRLVG